MNLPSVVKNEYAMKPYQKTPSNDRMDRPMPQDMFGLGIQIFKIESRKETPKHGKSVGKPKPDMKAIEAQNRKTSHIPAIPRSHKTSVLLPSISRTSSEKSSRLEGVEPKTETILSRKSVEKPTRVMNTKIERMDIIMEYKTGSHLKTTQQKGKYFNNRPNKSVDVLPETEALNPSEIIVKEEWRYPLNTIHHFYTSANEFSSNELTKIGRRKNQELLGEETSFVEAYVNGEDPFFPPQTYFDPFSIENFSFQSEKFGYQDKSYENFISEK